MIYYYLKSFQIKLKYIVSFFYFELYKVSLRLYFNLFKGPNLSFSFYNTRNSMFYDYIGSRSVVSPFFVFILLNRGLWFMFNFDFWLGSRLLPIKPKINILRNNIRQMPLKYKRKQSVLRLISYHNSIIQRHFFIKLIFLLTLVEISFIIYSFYTFFFLLIYIFLPFLYIISFNLYKKFIKILNLGIKLSLLKPISFNKENIDFVGNLNSNLFLNVENYFFEIKKIFNKNYNLIWLSFNELSLSKSLVLQTKDKVNFKNINILDSLFKKLNKFWLISRKRDKLQNTFFLNFTKRRLSYFTDKLTFLNKFLLGYMFIYRKLGLWYLYNINLIVSSSSFWKIFRQILVNNFKIILFFSILVILLFSFKFLLILAFIFICFIIYDYILYKDYYKNLRFLSYVNHTYLEISNSSYGLEVGFRLNGYDFLRIYEVEGFNISNYLMLLKLEINIFNFEQFLNNLNLEQEYFYKKKEFLFNNDDLSLKRQLILNKYSVLFKNRFKYYNSTNELFDCKIKLQRTNNELEKSLTFFKNKSIKYFLTLKNTVNDYNENLFLENNKKFEVNKLINSNLSISQRYYYYTYGLKLLK